MEIVTPGIGLIFWTSLCFLSVVFLLGKVAVKPIAAALKEREDSIAEALSASEKAKSEVDDLKAEVEKLKKEARAEREEIINEARKNANQIIAEAQEKAKEESNRIIKDAQESIANERDAALAKVRSEVGRISVDIAEKIIRKELKEDVAQESLINDMIKDIRLN